MKFSMLFYIFFLSLSFTVCSQEYDTSAYLPNVIIDEVVISNNDAFKVEDSVVVAIVDANIGESQNYEFIMLHTLPGD